MVVLLGFMGFGIMMVEHMEIVRKWDDAISRETFDVRNPYSNEILYGCANCDVQDAKKNAIKAIKVAKEALKSWSLQTTAKARGQILHQWYKICTEKEMDLAKLLTLEQGKPLVEAVGEIRYSASFMEWFAGEARRTYGQIVPPPTLNRVHLHTREPIGVVVLITPWNFPAAMIARKAAAALAVGCTVVVKPAEDTPLSALALAQVAKDAGIPNGVFNVLPADRQKTEQISKFVCSSVDVDAISFTGSIEVGKLLLSQSASTVKRVCLELGGNAPLIVFDSADLAKAIEGTMAAKFRGTGQVCVAANRIFVHSSVHDAYVEGLKKKIDKLVIGDGMKDGTNQGPLINERAVSKVLSLIEDAVSKGAKIVCGGKRGEKSTLFQPTLITNVKSNMEIAHTEIFGPVAAIRRFDGEEEVLKIANDSRSGLAGYFFSTDYSQIMRVARQLQLGMVGVNEGMISCAEAAFGGVKESGLGREGASQGIDEFSQWKYTCIAY
ncbi:unnamed protein product [Dracunculus medinensis]|uniref:Aldedh domain-containing protein n=1 Tax=Dracunculus medinensis TaxID=318479 RepID=A0A0N4UBM3_DRAME|nr:unnamed protein product [Dracunculus medinensis]